VDSRTPDRPRLKAHLAARVVLPDKVFLLAEDGHFLVRGEAAAAIVSYLDGRHTTAEIVEAVSDRVPFADCVLALSKFRRFGHLADGHDGDLARPAVAAWEARGVDPRDAASRLAAATVSLTAIGDVDADAMQDLHRPERFVHVAEFDRGHSASLSPACRPSRATPQPGRAELPRQHAVRFLAYPFPALSHPVGRRVDCVSILVG